MNRVVIFFVPINATQWDFETALRDHFASLNTKAPHTARAAKIEAKGAEELPMWTWFLPNPHRNDL